VSVTALLSASGLTARFGGVVAVRGVDLALAQNELVCVIGPNGAGKSTLLDILSGTLRPDSGSLFLDGQQMMGRPAYRFCRAGIVRKFQGTNVFQWLSVRDNLLVAGLAAAANHGLPMPDPEEVLDLIKLAPQARVLAQAASHGQRQWLEVGMTLMCRPRLLLLDEPTAGMTVEGTKDMAGLVSRLRKRCAVVVIEHDMGFVESLGCRTLVMHQGLMIGEGDFETLRRDDTIRDVYLGRRSAGHVAH
jgi:ABC-type uncharacterized transport system ATPase subunit